MIDKLRIVHIPPSTSEVRRRHFEDGSHNQWENKEEERPRCTVQLYIVQTHSPSGFSHNNFLLFLARGALRENG